ncbi:MAG: glycoside hydrolase family 2 [Erysipelotrichaceae bacterium]|nr:glycoside hydrolase family 2 [Erysipelotrichaceae bacterium]
MNRYDELYPRPLLQRDSFFSLNGEWLCNDSLIEVPFPPESSLSGYSGKKEEFYYRKDFSLPEGFYREDDEVILHFGAVDQLASVTLNDHFLLFHEGGYTPFEIDITPYLKEVNHLEVYAVDHLETFYPYGKQTLHPHGMWYTPVSGIWQSVWIEARPKDGVRSLSIKTDDNHLEIEIETEAEKAEALLHLPVRDLRTSFEEGKVVFDLSEVPHELWSTDHPVLYDLEIATPSETVKSYCAFRKIERKKIGGHERLFLNGKPLFINGLLDQGYWSDGIFLPEDPEQIAKEITAVKELGYNCLRKHIKAEPEIFYHECDKQGILVMQDMINSGDYSFFSDTILPTVGISLNREKIADQKRFNFFIDTSKKIIARVRNHPCIFAYTIYNEGWGQQGASRAYEILREEDPERLFDSCSGWFETEKSDFDSKHIYFRNKVLKGRGKLLLLSECGGFSRRIEGHADKEKTYGYGKTDSEEALTEAILSMHEKMTIPSIYNGLCGVIMTQVSDVEEEINGLFTYDRKVCKVNKEKIREANERLQKIYEESIEKDKQ